MKTNLTTLLLFIALITVSQTRNQTAWQKIPDDTKHYAAGCLIDGSVTSITYFFTKKGVLSQILGSIAGIGAGALKEYYWDGHLNRGVKSNGDFLVTAWGSLTMKPAIFCVRDHRKRKQLALDTTYYQQLNQPICQ
jgi:hypothetical protein